jgi:glycosyltransferase involved in cell wall biosynthesis
MITADNNYDIVFLGGLFPKETENKIYEKSKSFVQAAANALQWNIVDGLDKCSGVSVKIINSLFIGAYPKKFEDLIIKTYRFKHNENSDDINVGFLNLFGIKHFVKYWILKPYLKKWANTENRKKCIIAYSLNYTFVNCLKYIKKVNPQIQTCIIVPDLPQYMNLSNKVSFLYRFLKNIEIKSIRKNMQYIDYYTLLTEQMAKFLKIDKNYTVVEGSSTDAFKNIRTNRKKDNMKYIVYTGTLNEKYGVLDLVKAFRKIDNQYYRLILCGSGDSEDKIRQYAKLDNRIMYKGQVKREDVLKLQMEATVLVNPRKNNEEYTKYSFPSKILEYLSSGTPTIAYKLDGIPNEYDDYIYYINGDSYEDIAFEIIEVCEKDENERIEFGERARKFVMENKNNIVQVEKILKMIQDNI